MKVPFNQENIQFLVKDYGHGSGDIAIVKNGDLFETWLQYSDISADEWDCLEEPDTNLSDAILGIAEVLKVSVESNQYDPSYSESKLSV